MKFHENPFSGSRVVPYGETDRRRDITKLIVALCSFAKAPKKECLCFDSRKCMILQVDVTWLHDLY